MMRFALARSQRLLAAGSLLACIAARASAQPTAPAEPDVGEAATPAEGSAASPPGASGALDEGGAADAAAEAALTPPPPAAPLPAAATAEPAPVPIAAAVVEPAPAIEPEPEYPVFEPSARLITGAELERGHPEAGQLDSDSRQPFFLQQARLKLSVRASEAVRLGFSADIDSDLPVRSAFINVRFSRKLQLRAGRFKRPFSGLELTSIGDLPFRSRGRWNDQLIERGGWGDRALGLMAHGKLKSLDLRYYAAVMNAAPSVDVPRLQQLRGVDVLGRLEYSHKLAKGTSLRIGLDGGHKLTETEIEGANRHLDAVGGDLRLRASGLTAYLEASAAQNPHPPTPPVEPGRTPWALDVVGYASYDIALGEGLALQPVLLGEWGDTDTELSEDESVRGVVGLNLVSDLGLRILPQVEIVRPLGDVGVRSVLATERYYLLLSLEI